MQKLFLIAFATLLIAGCSSKAESGKDIAKKLCDCSKKANELPTSDPNRGLAQNDCLKKQRDAWEKIKDDVERSKDFNEQLMKCAEEQLEKSFNK